MKGFLILILFSNFIFSQHKDIYGLWHNNDGEYVRITENNGIVDRVEATIGTDWRTGEHHPILHGKIMTCFHDNNIYFA